MEPQRAGTEEKTYTEEMILQYQPEVDKLTPYLPWLSEKMGGTAHTTYDGEGLAGHSITFPVYDSTLMSFVNTAKATSLINHNYVYTYSRNRIRTQEDERELIRRCETLADLQQLSDVLSKYILKGMTRGNIWSEGVGSGAFYHTIAKMQEILKKYS